MDRREYSRNPDGKWAPGYHPAGRLFLAGFLQACRECGKDNPTLLHSRNGCETGHPTQISSLSQGRFVCYGRARVFARLLLARSKVAETAGKWQHPNMGVTSDVCKITVKALNSVQRSRGEISETISLNAGRKSATLTTTGVGPGGTHPKRASKKR